MKFKIKIDRGEEVEIVEMTFVDKISAIEYCEIMSVKSVATYKLLPPDEK